MAESPRLPSRPHVAVPGHMAAEVTPAPVVESVVYAGEGDTRHINVEETIRMMAINIGQMRQATMVPGVVEVPLFDDAAITQVERKIKRAGRWGGWIWGVVSVVGFIFTTGVTYSVFMGANATDAEVEAANKASIIEHNGGVDPEAVDSKTHKPVGEHPDMQGAIQSNTDAIRTIEEDVLPPMIETQKRLDKRSEYQYELTKWESKKSEARRKRKPAPGKPERLEKIEGELLQGNYN